FLTVEEAGKIAPELWSELTSAHRAGLADVGGGAPVFVAAERLPELAAVHPQATLDPPIRPPATRSARVWTREAALAEMLRGRMTMLGPTTAEALARSLAVARADVEGALLALESEGAILRGVFESPGPDALPGDQQWCDRRLLARIHRYTLNRLRAEIEPVTPSDYMRFLFIWQHVDPTARLSGLDGLRAALGRLDGFEVAAGAWERWILPARVEGYEPSLLDTLCLTGEIGWARLSSSSTESTVVSATPIALYLREHESSWLGAADSDGGSLKPAARNGDRQPEAAALKPRATAVLDALRSRGALFVHELAQTTGLDAPELRGGIADLVAAGLVTSDGFAGLRAIVDASGRRPGPAGRWSIVPYRQDRRDGHDRQDGQDREQAIDAQARALLQRYGIVFRRVLAREVNMAPWRDLARVYRRLEASGEIRGGRFVSGMSGEQFALPDAVSRIREVRRTAPAGRL